MFSHVMIGTNDLDKANRSMTHCWARSACTRGVDRHRIFYRTKTALSRCVADDGKPATHPMGTVGFAAESAAQADAWQRPASPWRKTCKTRRASARARPATLYRYLRIPTEQICALHRIV